MYDRYDDDFVLGPEALSSLHFDADWAIDPADVCERDKLIASSSLVGNALDFDPSDESLADLECAEALRRTHATLLQTFD